MVFCINRVMSLFILIGIVFAGAIHAGSPVGVWKTISDKDGKPRALVRISGGNTLQAQIIKTFPRPGDKGICQKCPGKLKDKPIKGLRFVWGVKKISENTWEGGKILDPKSGKIYRCKITLDKSGNKLYVRGFVGISLFGRTQTWVR